MHSKDHEKQLKTERILDAFSSGEAPGIPPLPLRNSEDSLRGGGSEVRAGAPGDRNSLGGVRGLEVYKSISSNSEYYGNHAWCWNMYKNV